MYVMEHHLPGLLVLLLLLLGMTSCTYAQSEISADPRKSPSVKHMPTDWCRTQIPGCTKCVSEQPKVAQGVQHPGAEGPLAALEAIVRCTACASPMYVYNKDNENCDCAAGAGSAYLNGTLIQAEMDLVGNDGWISLSDVFPEYSKGEEKWEADIEIAAESAGLSDAAGGATAAQSDSSVPSEPAHVLQKQHTVEQPPPTALWNRLGKDEPHDSSAATAAQVDSGDRRSPIRARRSKTHAARLQAHLMKHASDNQTVEADERMVNGHHRKFKDSQRRPGQREPGSAVQPELRTFAERMVVEYLSQQLDANGQTNSTLDSIFTDDLRRRHARNAHTKDTEEAPALDADGLDTQDDTPGSRHPAAARRRANLHHTSRRVPRDSSISLRATSGRIANDPPPRPHSISGREKNAGSSIDSSSSSDQQVSGWSSGATEHLVCGACPANWVSAGGLLGGTFCRPCQEGYEPDASRKTCKPVRKMDHKKDASTDDRDAHGHKDSKSSNTGASHGREQDSSTRSSINRKVILVKKVRKDVPSAPGNKTPTASPKKDSKTDAGTGSSSSNSSSTSPGSKDPLKSPVAAESKAGGSTTPADKHSSALKQTKDAHEAEHVEAAESVTVADASYEVKQDVGDDAIWAEVWGDDQVETLSVESFWSDDAADGASEVGESVDLAQYIEDGTDEYKVDGYVYDDQQEGGWSLSTQEDSPSEGAWEQQQEEQEGWTTDVGAGGVEVVEDQDGMQVVASTKDTGLQPFSSTSTSTTTPSSSSTSIFQIGG